jgi:hypothetical protein
MRKPKGIQKVIDLYAERIQAVAGGVAWNYPLGCGSFGCVFPLHGEPRVRPYSENRKLVLKISTDPTEGPVVAAIMATGLDKRLDGLARWEGVWKIPEPIQPGPRGTAWVIVREDVNPFHFDTLSPPVSNLSWQRKNWFDSLRSFNAASRKSFTLKTKWKAERFAEEAQGYLGEIWNFEETYNVAEAIEELGRHDIVLADVHQFNLGFRTHDWSPVGGQEPTGDVRWYDGKDRRQLLIFDPGHSSAPEAKVQDLWTAAVQTNPWLPDAAAQVEEL